MPLYLKDNRLIVKEGKLGVSDACCCQKPCDCCAGGYGSTYGAVIWVWVQGFVDQAGFCQDVDPVDNCYAGLNGYWTFQLVAGDCQGNSTGCGFHLEITRSGGVCGYPYIKGTLEVLAYTNGTPAVGYFQILGSDDGNSWYAIVSATFNLQTLSGPASCTMKWTADEKVWGNTGCWCDDTIFNVIWNGP